MTKLKQPAAHRYKVRSLFISDLHLGSKNCKAKFLRELLNRVDADYIYLDGDIIDGHRLQDAPFWQQEHEQVLDLVHQKAEQGTKVTYIAGNHDEGLRPWMIGEKISLDSPEQGLHYRGITYKPLDIHTDATGKRHLVIHTDQFDSSATRWFYGVGDKLYDFMAWSNRQLNKALDFAGLPYWSLSGVCKRVVKRVMGAVNRVDHKIVAAAHKYGTQGVVGGHTHDAVDEVIDGIEVRNDGDMVDSITALIEDHQGNMRILEWAPLVNDYKARLRRKEAEPQEAFAVLATKFGAIAQDGPVLRDFNKIAAVKGNIASRYQDIIDIATYGPERMRHSVRSGMRVHASL